MAKDRIQTNEQYTHALLDMDPLKYKTAKNKVKPTKNKYQIFLSPKDRMVQKRDINDGNKVM